MAARRSADDGKVAAGPPGQQLRTVGGDHDVLLVQHHPARSKAHPGFEGEDHTFLDHGLVLRGVGGPLDFDALSEVWAVRMKISELLGDVIRLPAPAMVLEQVEDLIKRIGTAHDGDHLVALFDEYHVILLGLMPEGPVRRIYDQMYAQTARMFAVLIPKLDLALEIEAVETELREFGEALRRADSQRIAEIRLAALRALLDRINSTPLIASSPSP